MSRIRNLEKERLATKRWRANNPEANLLAQIRGNAQTRNREFELTLSDLQKMLLPMQCEVTGKKLSWQWNGPGNNPWAPSIDRIDCSKGYIKGNMRVVCWAYNIARRDWPDAIVFELAKSLLGKSEEEPEAEEGTTCEIDLETGRRSCE